VARVNVYLGHVTWKVTYHVGLSVSKARSRSRILSAVPLLQETQDASS